ncbi:hypothetical protein ACP70R_019436 [Stipagrostis hirtigluma subsp. patula]
MEATNRSAEPTAPPPVVESAAAVASVLGDDDLLREILLRLGFPTCLVRAAAVSKRWLRHASDPTFLRRFRARHPPRLLGFYVSHPGLLRHLFVSLPQPPELAVPLRRAVSSCFEDLTKYKPVVMDCRNGRLVIDFFDGIPWYPLRLALLRVLHTREPASIVPRIPPLPRPSASEAPGVHTYIHHKFILDDGGGDGVTLVNLSHAGGRVSAYVYVLQPDGWSIPTMGVTELPDPETVYLNLLSPVHGNIYLSASATPGYVLGLNLTDARFFILELPDGVSGNFNLSRAEGSGLYLVHANRFQLSVWHHRMDGDPAQGWLLVDTFWVLDVCKHFPNQNWVSADSEHTGRVSVVAVGDNAEFVFLDIEETGVVVHVHLKSRTAKKVYQRMPGNQSPASIFPLMMIWPPVFPASNEEHDQGE